jgi:hypothetical protein
VAIKAAQYAPLDKKYDFLAQIARRTQDLKTEAAKSAQGISFHGAQQGLALQKQIDQLERLNQHWIKSLENDAASQRSSLKINEANVGNANEIALRGAVNQQGIDRAHVDTRNQIIRDDNTTENLLRTVDKTGGMKRAILGDVSNDYQQGLDKVLAYSERMSNANRELMNQQLEFNRQQAQSPFNQGIRLAGLALAAL